MNELQPFQLLPEFVERVWGTRDLSFLYKHPVGATPIGEVWLTGDQCRVASGPHQGRTLDELAREFGATLTGDSKCADRFPLLMKVLFPKDKLSVQVHPDDTTAQAAGEPCGKTECWYILHAEPGAQIGLGFQPDTTPQEIERAIHEHRMEHLLNWLDVQPGEMYYVDAGTVHAIGPGSVIVETQQNSDTTYRLYDYGRPRELHIEQGMAAMKAQTHAGRTLVEGEMLISSPCFAVERFSVQQPRKIVVNAVAHCIFTLDGAIRIESQGAQPITLTRGEIAVVPACTEEYTLAPQWEAEVLVAHLPTSQTGEPRTELYRNEVLAGRS